MSSIKIQDGLPDIVAARFHEAKESGDLRAFDSTVAVLKMNGIPFQLRYCPTLKSKPNSNGPKSSSSTPFNPFLNPSPALFITDIGPSHHLVLNKFALTPNHTILATKTFKPQTDLLAAEDLEATYALLTAYRLAGHRLFGFFNSGPHSGASQPHRHVQFLPVESMREGLEEGAKWELLADGLADAQAKIPFTYFAAPIKEGESAEKLHETYLALHKMASYAMDTFAKRPGEFGEGSKDMSYNLAFTDNQMVILPRRWEGLSFPTGLEDPKETGVVALNGTVLGGTLLVKDELEWEALKRDGGMLKELLNEIGIPFSTFAGDVLGWKGAPPSGAL
ncbi:bifunctional AP-4-A phosphorylase/ADP sulfurylase [Pseudogymnoascus australis]